MADKYKEEKEEENKVFHIAMICRFFQQRNEEISFCMYGRYRFGRRSAKKKIFVDRFQICYKMILAKLSDRLTA